MEIIARSFNGLTISQRKNDGYINLNQLADASGKRIDNWKRLKETTSFLREFSSSPEYQGIQPLIEFEGRNGGTWAHPDIAIQFAQWCSSAFALQVSRWVRDWMTTRENPLHTEALSENLAPEAASKVKGAIAFPELADFCQKQLALMGLKPELQRIYLLRAMEAQYTEQSPAFNTLLTAAKENCTVPDHHITPTKLGELYAQRHDLDKPVLPADINRALEAAGLQRKEVEVRSNGKKRNVWHLTERGEEYGILLLDKASRVDKTVQVVRWLPSVLAEINVHTFTNS